MGCGGDGGAFWPRVRCQAYCQGSSALVCLLMDERGVICGKRGWICIALYYAFLYL